MAILNKVQIYAGTGSRALAEKIALDYGQSLGEVTISKFADGEMQPNYHESVRGCDVFIYKVHLHHQII